MFFSTDVETTGLVPGFPGNHLVTIGIVPVDEKGSILAGADPEDEKGFYIRVRNELHNSWYDESIEAITPTQSWWREQDKAIFMDTFIAGPRFYPGEISQMLLKYVKDMEPDPEKRFFVANPVSFDKPWIDHLFASTHIPNPFHYRSLCLRSMRFGQDNSQTHFGWHRDTEPSLYPHHAYYDAYAQAKDLSAMIGNKNRQAQHVCGPRDVLDMS